MSRTGIHLGGGPIASDQRPLRSCHGTAAVRNTLMPDPVVVIGGGLAGLAAAARLAKIGTRWSSTSDPTGWAAPGPPTKSQALSPWTMRHRSSAFRHPGVTCSQERPPAGSRAGQDGLRPGAGPAGDDDLRRRCRADLPTDRGGQHATLAAAYGNSVAMRWRICSTDSTTCGKPSAGSGSRPSAAAAS